MASDPTGTVGSTAGQDNNLGLAVKGGATFLERLAQLADALDRHERALAELQLGQDAKSAFDDAQRKRAEADELRKQAADALAEAQAKAKKIIDAAKAERAAAVEISANANAMQRELEKRQAQLEAREQAATAAIAKAERAETAANRMRDDFQRRIDYLRTKMRELAA